MDSLPNHLTPLSFNRHEFTKVDFNVDRFLSQTRNHVTLEQLKEDLHLYLKILQNAMIELINKDYADFVNLSSNLVGLKPCLQKLQNGLQDVGQEFVSHVSALHESMARLQEKVEFSKGLATEQDEAEERILSLRTLLTLKSIVESDRIFNETTVQRLVLLLRGFVCCQQLLSTKDGLMTKLHDRLQAFFLEGLESKRGNIVISALKAAEACRCLDVMQEGFIARYCSPRFEKCLTETELDSEAFRDHFECLKLLLNTSKSFHSDFAPLFCGSMSGSGLEKGTNSGKIFLQNCILTSLLDIIEREFGDVLVPADAALFQQCYSLLTIFAQEFGQNETGKCAPLMMTILDRFSLSVYYELRMQEVRERMRTVDDVPFFETLVNERFQSEVTAKFTFCLINLWAEDVYLGNICHHLWSGSCEIMNQFDCLLEQIYNELVAKFEAHTSGKSKKMAGAHGKPGTQNAVSNGMQTTSETDTNAAFQLTKACTLIISDSFRFMNWVQNDFFQGTAFARFSQQFPSLMEDEKARLAFESCIEEFRENAHGKLEKIKRLLGQVLAGEMIACLLPTAEIPRQYRWTRKEAPLKASAFLPAAFRIIEDFCNLAQGNLSSAIMAEVVSDTLGKVLEDYKKNLSSVLVSVNKISTSLNRLKKSASKAVIAGSGESGTGSAAQLSDDDKIRLQLTLDVKEFVSLVESLSVVLKGVDLESLSALVKDS